MMKRMPGVKKEECLLNLAFKPDAKVVVVSLRIANRMKSYTWRIIFIYSDHNIRIYIYQ